MQRHAELQQGTERMSKRTTLTPFTGIFVTLAALTLSTVSGNEVLGADECLAAPNRDPAAGMQWYYFLDRAHQRKCWYQDAAGKKIHRSSNPAPQPATSKSTATSDDTSSNTRRQEPRPADRLRFNTVNPAGIDSFAMRWPGRPARYDEADPKPAPPSRSEGNIGTPPSAADPWPAVALATSETTAPSTVGQARAETPSIRVAVTAIGGASARCRLRRQPPPQFWPRGRNAGTGMRHPGRFRKIFGRPLAGARRRSAKPHRSPQKVVRTIASLRASGVGPDGPLCENASHLF